METQTQVNQPPAVTFDKEHESEILVKVKEVSKRVDQSGYLRPDDKKFLKDAAEYFASQMPKPQGLLDPGILVNRYLVIACETPRYTHDGNIKIVASHAQHGTAVEISLTKDEAERLSRILLNAVEYVRCGRNLANVNDMIARSEKGR